MYHSENIQNYSVDTVLNQKEFIKSLEFKDCPNVGHSLVAKTDLKAGTKVLIEKPILSYELDPKCRSSVSPYYSKKMWNALCSIVQDNEKQGSDTSTDDQNSEYDGDEEEDEDEDSRPASAFCPGVPAAMVAYLSISPPSHLKERKSPLMCAASDLNFYYYPDTEEWADHPTVALVRDTVEQAVSTIPEFRHLNPSELAAFVLKIYSNAHTVAYENNRTLPTHSKRKQRREAYRWKTAVDGSPLLTTSWPSDPGSRMASKIALLPWGSKFAHSCSPNLFLRYDPAAGTMIFTLVRDVRSGELLTFSYLPEDDSSLGGLLCGTTESRRQKTWNFKFFTCTCERCNDFDWARGVQCQQCLSDRCYREGGDGLDELRLWTCLDCKTQFNVQDIEFIASNREHNVQQVAIAFGADVKGSPNQSMLRMMEPYLLSLLDPSTDPYDSDGELKDPVPPIPSSHWTFAYFHYLLSSYHLRLFPGYFGRGLSKSLGMNEKGFKEAQIYLEWLDKNLWSAPSKEHDTSETNRTGNKMAAFFASWQIVETCIDVLLDETSPQSTTKEEETGDSDDEETISVQENMDALQLNDTQLQPIAQPCLDVCFKVVDLIEKHWRPLIMTVLPKDDGKDTSNVTDTMLDKIDRFIDRVQQLQKMN
ncbi:unnamed protein product [Umbelopsis vinacea]